MTYDDFQLHLASAGIKLQEFADMVKMNRTSIYNYGKAGEVPEQMAVLAVLLRDMHERGVDYREVLGRNGIEVPKRASRDEGQPDVKA